MDNIALIVSRIRKTAKGNGQDLKSNRNQSEKKTTQDCCNICGGTTWVFKTNKEGEEVATRCKCYSIQLAKEKWQRSGFNPENKEKTFESYKAYNQETKEAKSRAAKYIKNFNDTKDTKQNSILFMGQPGSGKTHLSMAISINLLNSGIAAVYFSYRDIITALKQNMCDEEYYQKQINSYKKAAVLFIDDLFKGKITETDINIMFEIINYRYLNNLPIIVSTEYDVEKLLNTDEAIASRIIEMSKGNIVLMESRESNYRLRV